LSIAWAVAEYLHDLHGQGVRTIFATHYHELVELAKTKPRVRNFNVAIREWQGKMIFLRKLVAGGVSRSYGLAVAKMAGLPAEVLTRAAEILHKLENGGFEPSTLSPRVRSKAGSRQPEGQLSLFSPPPDGLVQELRRLEVENMTPLEALNKLAELKRLV